MLLTDLISGFKEIGFLTVLVSYGVVSLVLERLDISTSMLLLARVSIEFMSISLQSIKGLRSSASPPNYIPIMKLFTLILSIFRHFSMISSMWVSTDTLISFIFTIIFWLVVSVVCLRSSR